MKEKAKITENQLFYFNPYHASDPTYVPPLYTVAVDNNNKIHILKSGKDFTNYIPIKKRTLHNYAEYTNYAKWNKKNAEWLRRLCSSKFHRSIIFRELRKAINAKIAKDYDNGNKLHVVD